MVQSSWQRYPRNRPHCPRGLQSPWDFLPRGDEFPRPGEDGFSLSETTECPLTWAICLPCSCSARYWFALARGQFAIGALWVPHLDSRCLAEHLTIWEIPLFAASCRNALQELCVLWRKSIEYQHLTLLEEEYECSRRSKVTAWELSFMVYASPDEPDSHSEGELGDLPGPARYEMHNATLEDLELTGQSSSR